MNKNKYIIAVLIIILIIIFTLYLYNQKDKNVKNNFNHSVKKEIIGKWEFLKEDYSFELSLWKKNGKIEGNYCLFTTSKINCPFKDFENGEPDYNKKNIEQIDGNNFLVFNNRINDNSAIVEIDLDKNTWKFKKINLGESFIIPYEIKLKKVK